MHIDWRAIALAFVSFSIASGALLADEIETDVFASMTGKCTRLRVADRDFTCTSVAFSHSPGGRSGFTVPLTDEDDDTHIITFSGENGTRQKDDLYELTIDRMLLKSKDRPKLDGLPIPSIELSTGTCKQIGDLARQQVSSISCNATDEGGRRYELQFESDGSPINVRMIRAADPAAEEERTRMLAAHMEQLRCRQKAIVQSVMPRDRTNFVLRCMEE